MALAELFTSNQASTTVSSGGTTAPSGGTSESWTVASSASFGAAATGISQFHVADPAQPSELIAVTNVSGTTWTVTRGAESTTPVAHSAGFTVYQVVSAGWLAAVAAGATPAAAVSSGTTLNSSIRLYLINAASGNMTMTLPSPSANTDVTWLLKRTDNTVSVVTIAPAASELIDGASFGYIPNSVGAVAVTSDGTNWWTT